VQAGLRPAERVLVHAVGSGVGLAAAQLARAVGGVPYGTSRTVEKIERSREYGLEDGVLPGADFAEMREAVKRWTGGKGMHVILDLVGGAYVQAGVDALGDQGRLILVGTLAGTMTQIDLRRILTKRLLIRGTVLRARPLEEKILATSAFEREVVPLLARGALRPVIDSEFPLAEIRAAHERLTSNQTVGKVVVVVADD
jgi:NADPH:quinone reductase-like Zn-dependent oxidoreductase